MWVLSPPAGHHLEEMQMFRMCEAAVTVEVEEAVTEYQFSFPDFLVFVGGDTVRVSGR